MIFYLLAAINTVLVIVFGSLLIKYRHNPMIVNRDWPLIILTTGVMGVVAILHAVGYELYFEDDLSWSNSCRYLLSWPTMFLVPASTCPVLCRAYNIQFKFHFNQEKSRMKADTYYKWKHTATLKYNLIALIVIFIIMTVPVYVSSALVPFPENPENVTQCFSYFTYIFIGQGIPMSFMINYLFYKFMKLKDPYHIKVEFGWQITTGFLLFAAYMPIQLYDTATGGVNFPDSFHPFYLISLYCFNCTICNLIYPVYLALKDQRMDYGMELDLIGEQTRRTSISHDVSLKSILGNQGLFEAFREITVEYWCVESLLFVASVDKYKTLSPEKRREEGEKIVKIFLEPESQLYVNINGNERHDIVALAHKGDFEISLFDPAYKDVLAQLEGILIRWKTTSSFKHTVVDAGRNSSDRDSIILFHLDLPTNT